MQDCDSSRSGLLITHLFSYDPRSCPNACLAPASRQSDLTGTIVPARLRHSGGRADKIVLFHRNGLIGLKHIMLFMPGQSGNPVVHHIR